MAKYVNAAQSFKTKYAREIEEFKKCFIDYARLVYPQKPKAAGGIQQAADEVPPLPPPEYPSLADIEPCGMSKKELVTALRTYFKQHYGE
jgi:hypothetical protein